MTEEQVADRVKLIPFLFSESSGGGGGGGKWE